MRGSLYPRPCEVDENGNRVPVKGSDVELQLRRDAQRPTQDESKGGYRLKSEAQAACTGGACGARSGRARSSPAR